MPIVFKAGEITLSSVVTLVGLGTAYIWGYARLDSKVDQLATYRLEEREMMRTSETKRDLILESLNTNMHILSERVVRVETKVDITNSKQEELKAQVRGIPGAGK